MTQNGVITIATSLAPGKNLDNQKKSLTVGARWGLSAYRLMHRMKLLN
ncbi:hypothetical protein [Pelosinus baikalensis]|uniref:Uncharacterized protein n=1 Tax=Pelosinus baikalensis TaxID=2892015 RepID=A0ABS8HY19_9FIRM|nr:hypothetical protein [Pelosinus baikalensis]MCC5468066.1 hypothetical protein [Pelosinus baikalensis]